MNKGVITIGETDGHIRVTVKRRGRVDYFDVMQTADGLISTDGSLMLDCARFAPELFLELYAK